MKFYAFVLLLAFCYVECRKAYVPINKNANIDFINMEGGGVKPPQNNNRPAPGPAPVQKPQPVPGPLPMVPSPQQPSQKPTAPNVAPTPTQAPHLITPKPVNPTPASKLITTPGPGSVKSLVNFYDSQGKASPIRPYSYSQAVKQG
ncbi:unnamed protein product, partial [Brenthis ino]